MAEEDTAQECQGEEMGEHSQAHIGPSSCGGVMGRFILGREESLEGSNDFGAVTCSSLSRLEEPRLRPRTCTACRACVAAKLQKSGNQTDVPKLQPLSRTNHLPYYSGKDDEGGPNRGGGAKKMTRLPDSRKLISCQFKAPRSVSGSISSKSSRHSEVRMPSPPALPRPCSSGLPSVGFRYLGAHLSHSSDAELRKWIVEFGGDERAAFMARGLQKLQLAYEKGKSEIDQRTEDNTPSVCLHIS